MIVVGSNRKIAHNQAEPVGAALGKLVHFPTDSNSAEQCRCICDTVNYTDNSPQKNKENTCPATRYIRARPGPPVEINNKLDPEVT